MRLISTLIVFLTLLVSMPPTAAAQEYDSKMGWKLRAPKGWKMGQEDGRILFGSDTEAGLIVAWFEPGLDVAGLMRESVKGINEDGLMLKPTAAATEFKAKGGKAVDVMLSGSDVQGTALKGRATGVAGPNGSVVILGVTTPEHFANISKRVREVADGVAFYKPKTGDATKLRGTFCMYSSYSSGSGSDSYSSSISRKMTFDGAGRVGWGSQLLVSGSNVSGIAGSGKPTELGAYSVMGNSVNIQWADSRQTCMVHFRQDNGQITELKCNGTLWAPQLCD